MPPETIDAKHKRKSIKFQKNVFSDKQAIQLNQLIGSTRRQSVLTYQNEELKDTEEATLD